MEGAKRKRPRKGAKGSRRAKATPTAGSKGHGGGGGQEGDKERRERDKGPGYRTGGRRVFFDEDGEPMASAKDEGSRRGAGSPRGLVGLSNLGNTCYMNAALQCLLNTPSLADFFETCPALVVRDEKPGGGMARAFGKLVDDVRNAGRGGGYVAPISVLYALKTAHPMFRGFQQHDSQEFLRCIMDLLHEELMEPVAGGASGPEDSEDEDGDEEDGDFRGRVRKELEFAGGSSDVASGGGSPLGSDVEPEEYETADSGVSEQSSNDGNEEEEDENAKSGEDAAEDNIAQGSRKRRRSSVQKEALGGGGDSRSGKREREGDVASASDKGIGSSSSRVPSLATSASLSDVELEFADALSSTSGSPPLSSSPRTASLTEGSLAARSPAKSVIRMVPVPPFIQKRKPKVYRSVISDIFDGKLVSSVQCLTCDRVSMTTEVFQDLSLPIPASDTLAALRGQSQQQLVQQQQQQQESGGQAGGVNQGGNGNNSGWLSWAWGWVSSWFYGPNITLVDCLSYFFSADELKGENMYSCERCKKLRNGLKFSRVTVLPDTLCIHLKRFRHDFAFSSKVSSKVTFPLVDLDMSPWLHKDSYSSVSLYDLTGVICHHGSAGGGHYTAYALNPFDEEWYEFDDSVVTRVDPAAVTNAEAYVLFYRKNGAQMEPVREMASLLLERARRSPSLVQFHVSRQWLNKFENLAEPGPIDNSDFLCRHGGVLPEKSSYAADLCLALPQPTWDLLHRRFGGGPACTRLHECANCRAELDALNRQKTFELEEFKSLHAEFQEEAGRSHAVYCLSSSWFKQWEGFVTNRARDPPGPIDNKAIITSKGAAAGGGVGQQGQQQDRAAAGPGGQQQQLTLRHNSDYVQISQNIWLMFHSIYGGGPEVVVRANGVIQVGGGTSCAGAFKSTKQSLPGLSAARLRSRATSESAATPAQGLGLTARPGFATRSKTKSSSEVSPDARGVGHVSSGENAVACDSTSSAAVAGEDK